MVAVYDPAIVLAQSPDVVSVMATFYRSFDGEYDDRERASGGSSELNRKRMASLGGVLTDGGFARNRRSKATAQNP
jgi:hypothetical protein